MTMDVQQHHYVCVIRSWRRDTISRKIWAGIVFSDAEIYARAQEHGVQTDRVALDAGDNQEQRVYRICAKYNWIAFNGTKVREYFHIDDTIWRFYSPAEVGEAFPGLGTQKKNILEYRYSSNSAKNRLQTIRNEKLPDGTPLWTIADDSPRAYIEEIDNEIPVEIRSPEGAVSVAWKTLGPNHYFDCEVMQVTAAAICGLIGGETFNPERKEDALSHTMI